MTDLSVATCAGHLPDKRQVAASFSKAAVSYDSVADLQRAVGTELMARLPAQMPKTAPSRWLDMGSGTGCFSRTLAQNQHVSVTLFSFDKGEEISTHESGGDAFVTCLDGVGRITIDGLLNAVEQLRHFAGLQVVIDRRQFDADLFGQIGRASCRERVSSPV